MTAASATVRDLGHTIEVVLETYYSGLGAIGRPILFSPEEAVAVFEALHKWVSGDKEEKR